MKPFDGTAQGTTPCQAFSLDYGSDANKIALDAIRARAQKQLSMLHAGLKRFENPHQYPAGLELGLHEFKTELILRAKGEI